MFVRCLLFFWWCILVIIWKFCLVRCSVVFWLRLLEVLVISMWWFWGERGLLVNNMLLFFEGGLLGGVDC